MYPGTDFQAFILLRTNIIDFSFLRSIVKTYRRSGFLPVMTSLGAGLKTLTVDNLVKN